jgi:hypothetical protein
VGMPASAHFGAGLTGPIQVVQRSYQQIVALGAIAAGGAVGFLAALTLILLQLWRGRRLGRRGNGEASATAGGADI